MASRFDTAYEHILGEILSGRLSPGAVINRRDVAENLGVSISPVGEAMLQLELEGVLETIPRKGTRVRRPCQRDVWGLMISRIAMECQAARMICGAPVTTNRERLAALARDMDEAPAGGPVMIRADAVFHRALVTLADCPVLLWHFDRVIRQSLLLLQAVETPPHKRGNHVALVDALETDDPDKAETAMREHIQKGKAAMALERGLYQAEDRLRLGRSPLLAQQRMGRSMERLLDIEGPAR